MNTSCTRRLSFDAAHRVPRHESKCRMLHGHRYDVDVTAEAVESLDAAGRVVDFGVIKELVGGWLDREWDHTTILDGGADKHLADTIDAEGFGRPVLRLAGPPTAEVMATTILTRARLLLAPLNVRVTRVRVYETPNCWADAE